jgi:hypothetical protein
MPGISNVAAGGVGQETTTEIRMVASHGEVFTATFTEDGLRCAQGALSKDWPMGRFLQSVFDLGRRRHREAE